MFETTARCPVCDAVLDTIAHPDKELNSMGAAMLLGDARRDHRRESPACALDDRWHRGWITSDPVEIPDKPTPEKTLEQIRLLLGMPTPEFHAQTADSAAAWRKVASERLDRVIALEAEIRRLKEAPQPDVDPARWGSASASAGATPVEVNKPAAHADDRATVKAIEDLIIAGFICSNRSRREAADWAYAKIRRGEVPGLPSPDEFARVIKQRDGAKERMQAAIVERDALTAEVERLTKGYHETCIAKIEGLESALRMSKANLTLANAANEDKQKALNKASRLLIRYRSDGARFDVNLAKDTAVHLEEYPAT